MPTFSKIVVLGDGESRVIERTTDDPNEITRMCYSGWEQKPEEKQPEKSKPAAQPAISGPKSDTNKP